MPTNVSTGKCMRYHRGALIFCSPKPSAQNKINQLAVQILDAWNLQIVDRIVQSPPKSFEIYTTSSLAAGKDLTLAEACNAVAKNGDPYRWIVLEKNKHCWGLFFAGGGLMLCRDQLKLDKNRSKRKPRQSLHLLFSWLLKLFDQAFNWQARKQIDLRQPSENMNNTVNPSPEPRPIYVNKNLVIPIHQSLQRQRVIIDLPDSIIGPLDELGTQLGKSRSETLKHLLQMVLLG